MAGVDLFLPALCYAKLADRTDVKECSDRARKWMKGQKNLIAPHLEDLIAFSAAAQEVLGSP